MGDESYRRASVMTRLYIICEGKSEQKFVDGALIPYIRSINQNIENFNKQESCLITTFVDYYRLGNDFPDYSVTQTIPDIYNRIEKLEHTMASHIKLSNFIPYIQIHEYEMLYFADLDNFINVDAELKSFT